MSQVLYGQVKWFNNSKGYGFIQPDDGGKDVFVHKTALIDDNIKDGQRVAYNIVENPRNGKSEAGNVKAA